MDKNYKIDDFLTNCLLPGKIDGSRINLREIEIPLVGITGWGTKYQRGKKQSVWICGEIVSPNYVGNNGCACSSHIEGIVTDNGEMKFLEAVNNFIAYEGSCFEYNLKVKDMRANSPNFEGDLTDRTGDKFKPIPAGKVYLTLDPYWAKYGEGKSSSCSLPFSTRDPITEIYMPQFWKTFLGQIEEQGYDHPCLAVTEKLIKERKEIVSSMRSPPVAP